MVLKTMKFSELEQGDIFRNEEGKVFLKTEYCIGVTNTDDRYDINAVNLEDGNFTSFAWETLVYHINTINLTTS